MSDVHGSEDMKKPDIRVRTYWAGVAVVCLAFVVFGEVTQSPPNLNWAVRTSDNAGYGVAPVLFGGGIAYLLHKFGTRGGGPGFERPIAGIWWWTFWMAAFMFAAHVRSMYR